MPGEAHRFEAARPSHSKLRRGLDTYMGRLLVLRTFGQFDQLAPEQLSAIAEHTRPQFFAAGSELYTEDQPVTHLYYIISGKVQLREMALWSTRSASAAWSAAWRRSPISATASKR